MSNQPSLEWSDFDDDERAKVPIKHAPNVVDHQQGQVGMTLQEQNNQDGHIYCDLTVEVRQ